MKQLHVKAGDTVVLLSGDYEDRYTKDASGARVIKTGKVIATSPEEGKVIVEGIHTVSKHKKARRQGENSEIVETAGAIYASKVQLYCPDCKKGVRTHTVVEIVDGKDGKPKKVKTRVCSGKKADGTPCGHKFD